MGSGIKGYDIDAREEKAIAGSNDAYSKIKGLGIASLISTGLAGLEMVGVYFANNENTPKNLKNLLLAIKEGLIGGAASNIVALIGMGIASAFYINRIKHDKSTHELDVIDYKQYNYRHYGNPNRGYVPVKKK